MALTDEQRAALAAEAARRNIKPADLIAAAEGGTASDAGGTSPAASTVEPPKLFMYHLPFVTVNEVRAGWLGLGPVSGGEEYAAAWSAKMLGANAPAPSEDPPA